MTKLYVGNLPFTATEESIRNLFAPHGTVEKISLISKEFDGRALKINEAQDRPRSGGSRY